MGDENGVADAVEVSDTSSSVSGAGAGEARSVVCPHEANTSVAKIVVAIGNDDKKCLIRLERRDMLMNSTTFIPHWGSISSGEPAFGFCLMSFNANRFWG